MKRFIIADLHFGHDNIIKYEKRPFSNAAEMDDRLIELWNSVVSRNDIVYVLGDFTLSRKTNLIKNILKLLHGKKILIMGNHDTKKPRDYIMCGFEVATKKPIMVDPGVILMHEPLNDVSLIAPNYIYFFGHVHSNHTAMDDYQNCMCVSAERIGYKPINLDKSIEEMKKLIVFSKNRE